MDSFRWKRLLGSLSPKLSDPKLGHLYRVDDEDHRFVFEIEHADYCIYEEDGVYWLTLFLEATSATTVLGDYPPFGATLEVSLYFDRVLEPDDLLGDELAVKSYDEDFYNLTDLYLRTHQSFDGTLIVDSVDERGSLEVRIAGEADGDPVALRALFKGNPERRRSFS